MGSKNLEVVWRSVEVVQYKNMIVGRRSRLLLHNLPPIKPAIYRKI